jgi:hypothetical protein
MRLGTVTILALLLALAPVPARAHFFPKKAPTLKAFLVQNYPPCTAPGATTSNGEQACEGPAEVDPSCVFSAKGLGTFSASVKGMTHITVTARLSGLDTGCEGKTLAAALGVRTTSDTCPTDHCTSVDREITFGSCVVHRGRCAINATIDPGFPSGAGSEMTILTCGVQDGVQDGAPLTFSCGIMIK